MSTYQTYQIRFLYQLFVKTLNRWRLKVLPRFQALEAELQQLLHEADAADKEIEGPNGADLCIPLVDGSKTDIYGLVLFQFHHKFGQNDDLYIFVSMVPLFGCL